MIFLDNNSTTFLSSHVKTSITNYMEGNVGNPSSKHSLGQSANRIYRSSILDIAQIIDVKASHSVLTSSASTSNNYVIEWFSKNYRSTLLTTTVEHSSIYNAIKLNRPNTKYLSVNGDGIINILHLREMNLSGIGLLSIQLVNNETGVIQPLLKIKEICKKNNIMLHVDATQAVGKLEGYVFDDINFVSFSAHKIHGPKGIGFLYIKDREILKQFPFKINDNMVKPVGTENILGAVGFAKACSIRYKELTEFIKYTNMLRNKFENTIKENIKNVTINGNIDSRISNTTNICFNGIDGQALVIQLDQQDIICSQTSACISQIPEPSYVLRAMGLNAVAAFSSIRFSFSMYNTIEEVAYAANKVIEIYNKIKIFGDWE